jgi:ATP-dependent DNA helicase RecG
VLNENYTKLLMKNSNMDLPTVILLDKVQKNVRLSKNDCRFLRSKNLIEGRYPNIFLASPVAAVAGEKAKYIRYRVFDDRHYKDMVTDLIKKFGSATRSDIDDLLIGKLSDALNDKQKRNRIANLLYAMAHKDNTIENKGTNRKPMWVLRSK